MGSAADWHAFLDEFRGFGGRAENVMQRKGALGMGLFPIDPSKPIDLFVPDALLVPIENIALHDGALTIEDESAFPTGYGDWFRRYQVNYSWGAEGRENTLDFEEGLKALPETVQTLLKRHGLYNAEVRFPGKEPDQELLQRFLRTRCINRKGTSVIMPMIDLLNHAPSAKPYDMSGDGIAVAGLHDGEILVRYNVFDPIRRLMAYGFNGSEPLAFSVRCQIQHQDRQVLVRPGINDRPMQPCKISLDADRLVIEQPLLGSMRSPKVPRTLFLQACMAHQGVNANELFDQIQQYNTIALVNLLRALEGLEEPVAQQLRKGCLDQLAALSYHFGQRDDLLNASETPSTSAA